MAILGVLGVRARLLRGKRSGRKNKKADATEHQGCSIASAYSLTNLPAVGRITLYIVIRAFRSTGSTLSIFLPTGNRQNQTKHRIILFEGATVMLFFRWHAMLPCYCCSQILKPLMNALSSESHWAFDVCYTQHSDGSLDLGLCHFPSGAMSTSASFGPQLPRR